MDDVVGVVSEIWFLAVTLVWDRNAASVSVLLDGLFLEAFTYVLRSDLFLVKDEVLVEQLGSLCLFLVPGFHGAFEFLRACWCRGVCVGEEVLLELELLCLEFIVKELRRLLIPGG